MKKVLKCKDSGRIKAVRCAVTGMVLQVDRLERATLRPVNSDGKPREGAEWLAWVWFLMEPDTLRRGPDGGLYQATIGL